MSSDGWGSSTNASMMLKGLIAQHHPSERELRLFSCACVRLTLEMVESLDEKTRADAMLIIDFVERTAENELQPPLGSVLADLAEMAELVQDGWIVHLNGYCSPLQRDAKNAAVLGIRYALGAYCDQQVRRTIEAADPELVRATKERVERARQGFRPLSLAERLIVRLAGLMDRGEALKSWFERPGAFEATTRASFKRMAVAEAGAPWKVAEQEARVAMESRLCELMREFFSRRNSVTDAS